MDENLIELIRKKNEIIDYLSQAPELEAISIYQNEIRKILGELEVKETQFKKEHYENELIAKRLDTEHTQISKELNDFKNNHTASNLEATKFKIEQEITDIENNIQEQIRRNEALETEIENREISYRNAETPPDHNALKLSFYKQVFGLSLLHGPDGSSNFLEICPPQATEAHSVHLNDSVQSNQEIGTSSSDLFGQVNRVWSLLSGKSNTRS